MQVEAVMETNVVKISKNKSLRQAAKTMNQERIGSLIIWEGDRSNFCGILTERDILEAVANEEISQTKVEDVMKDGDQVVTIQPDASLEEAADSMVDNSIKHLPVVNDQNQILGIVTATDLILYEDKLVEKLSQVFLYSQTESQDGFAS